MLEREGDHRLRESEETFHALVSGIKDYAIFMLDRDGRIVSWNEGAERIKGYAAEEILGKHLSVFYTQEAADAGLPDWELALAEREGRFEDEGLRVRKDGSTFWANVVISALWDEQGGLRGFAKVIRDVTEKRLDDERRAADREREANQLREHAQKVRIRAEAREADRSSFFPLQSENHRTRGEHVRNGVHCERRSDRAPRAVRASLARLFLLAHGA